MNEQNSRHLLARYRGGDHRAAEEIFEQYAQRLVALAGRRLSAKLARKVDPEDIVQSAFRSFFVAARDGRYALQRSGDLWRLLAQITVNKLLKKVEYYAARKRRLGAEECDADQFRLEARIDRLTQSPAGEDLLALHEELELVMRCLPPNHREMLARRLQGASIADIAGQFHVTERQVRRVLKKIENHFELRRAATSVL